MSYERFIKKDGKIYGPYTYQSKRVDGKIVSNYVKPHRLNKKVVFVSLAFLIVISLFVLAVYNYSSITGKVTLQISNDLRGDLRLGLKEGELLPANTIIRVNFNGEEKEFFLKDLADSSLANGSFYAENTELFGEGDGIGFVGEKISYPDVYFTLLLREKDVNQTESLPGESNNSSGENQTNENSEINETEEQSIEIPINEESDAEEQGIETQVLEEQPTETTPSEETLTTEAPAEIQTEQSTETPSEQSSPESSSEETSSSEPSTESESYAVITGNVVLSEDQIEGKVSAEENFEYDLQGRDYSIVNVYSGSEELSSSDLKTSVSEDRLIITTDYSYSETGFGKEFLGEDKEISIPLSEFGFEGNGTMNVEIVYDNISIAGAEKEISASVIETNVSVEPNITTKQYKAVINRPVRWVKLVNNSDLVELPREAENISIKVGEEAEQALNDAENSEEVVAELPKGILITGNVVADFGDSVTETSDSKIVDVSGFAENETQVAIEYTTPAPQANETNTSYGKQVVIYADDELNYTEILAYSELNNEVSLAEKNKIQLLWSASYADALRYNYTVENSSAEDSTFSISVDFDSYDLDEDGNIDYIEWIVPHLSSQTYSIVINSTTSTQSGVVFDNNQAHLAISSSAPYDSLVAYWNFDIDNSSTAFDLAGGNDGGYVANTVVSPGLFGKSLDVNGAGKGVIVASNSALNPPVITVSYWFNKVDSRYSYLIQKFGSSGAGNRQWNCFADSSANIVTCNFYNASSSSICASGNMAFTRNVWNHVVLSFNGTQCSFYFNGVSKANVSNTSAYNFNSPAIPIRMGPMYTSGQELNGSIDEVMIFNTSLSAAQVSAIYQNASARFVSSGTLNSNQANVSVGNNLLNITSSFTNYLGSNISLGVGFYNGSWFSTSAQNITGSDLFSVSSATTNVTLNYTLYAGTSSFYTPYFNGSNIGVVGSDNLAPSLSILYPANNSNLNFTENIPLNFSITEEDVGKICWYTNDSGVTNTIIASCANTTINVSQGTSTIILYANDTSGNINSTSIVIYADSIYPQILFSSNTEVNNSNVSQNWVFANVSVTEINPVNVSFGIYNSTWSNVTTYLMSTQTANTTINWTELADGIYYYNISVRDIVNNENHTETRKILLDTISPQWNPIPSNQVVNYGQNFGYQTSAIDSGIGISYYSLNDSRFIVDSSGYVQNASSLAVGVYWINESVNDTLGNTNSAVFSVSVNKITSTCTISGENVIYPDSVSVSGACTNPEVGYNLYMDDFLIANPFNQQLAAGTYNFTINSSDTQNYTGNSNSILVEVGKATPVLTFLANSGDQNLSLIYPQQVNISASASGGTLNFERDGVSVLSQNGQNVILAAGTYLYRANISGNQNYTGVGYSYYNVTIGRANSQTSLVFDKNSPQNYGTSIIPSCSVISGQGSATLTLDESIISSGQEVILGAGTYSFNCSLAEGQNYTSSSNSSEFVIDKASGVVYTYVNNSRANLSISQAGSFWLNATLGVGTGNIFLYNNGTLINSGSSPLENLTLFSTSGMFNITSIYLGNDNYTSAFETFWVNLSDSAAPRLTILSPANNSRFNVNNTPINYSASDENLESCWWNVNSGENNSIDCAQNISGQNWGEGLSIVRVYANDSSGLTNYSQVWFYTDTISPSITINSPLNQSYTNTSTLFNINTSESASCRYNLDSGTNLSMASEDNLEFGASNLSMSVGSHNVVFYCNDSSGNFNSSAVVFSINTSNGSNPPVTPPSNSVSPSGSSGGGGGGIVQPTNAKVSVSTEKLELELAFNTDKQKFLVIKNIGESKGMVKLSESGLGEIITFSETSFELESGQSKTVVVNFQAGKEAGVYVGKILINGEEVLVSINVQSKLLLLLFDAKIDLGENNKKVGIGEKLESEITLIPMGEEPRLDVTLNYIIKDYSGRVWMAESETILVDGPKNLSKSFKTDKLEFGKYVLGLEVVYPNGVAVSSSNFEVVDKQSMNVIILFWIVITLAVFVTIFGIIKYHKNINNFFSHHRMSKGRFKRKK